MANNTTFKIAKWEEKLYDEMEEGPKLTRASVSKSYEGAIEGAGTLEMLMVHGPDGSAVFTGLERVRGRVDGRSGSFVLQHNGMFEAGKARGVCFVVQGSGTEELRNLSGKADFEHGHAEQQHLCFEFRFGES